MESIKERVFTNKDQSKSHTTRVCSLLFYRGLAKNKICGKGSVKLSHSSSPSGSQMESYCNWSLASVCLFHNSSGIYGPTDKSPEHAKFLIFQIGPLLAKIWPFLWKRVTSVRSSYNSSSVCVGENQTGDPIGIVW